MWLLVKYFPKAGSVIRWRGSGDHRATGDLYRAAEDAHYDDTHHLFHRGYSPVDVYQSDYSAGGINVRQPAVGS